MTQYLLDERNSKLVITPACAFTACACRCLIAYCQSEPGAVVLAYNGFLL
jgi:hypothetical protein